MIEKRSRGPQPSRPRPGPAPNTRRPAPTAAPRPAPEAPPEPLTARAAAWLAQWTARRWVPLCAVVLGLGIFAYATLVGTTDEELIRARLVALADAIEVKPSEQNLVLRGARIKDAFGGIFVKEVRIEIPELTELRSGRMELVQLAAQAMTMYRTATVDAAGLSIDLDKASLTAVASGKVTLHATRHSGDAQLDTRTVSIRFDKIDGQWLIVSVGVSAKDDEARPDERP